MHSVIPINMLLPQLLLSNDKLQSGLPAADLWVTAALIFCFLTKKKEKKSRNKHCPAVSTKITLDRLRFGRCLLI